MKTKESTIPFHRPTVSSLELQYIQDAIARNHLEANGYYTQQCQQWLQNFLNAQKVLLTHSCTAALELCALLLDIQPGDEIIMPSYTFSSTANAFVLFRGVPVFVDIHPTTLNIDPQLIQQAITPKTKAIVAVHYAGVGCEMESLLEIAEKNNLYLIEDAAQALQAYYTEKPLGSFGHLSAFSFHATKNIVSGEGGALVINDSRFKERAEILAEKGTNRRQFLRGAVDKYTWIDKGSSYLPSELIAAFLLAQLEKSDVLTQQRLKIWNEYQESFKDNEAAQQLKRPTLPKEAQHNAHIYYLLLKNEETRKTLLQYLRNQGIQATHHYVPLHSAPAGLRLGKTVGSLTNTDIISKTMLRLPLWGELSIADQNTIIKSVKNFFL